MKKNIKKILIINFSLLIIFTSINITKVNAKKNWPSIPESISVPSIVVMDASSNQVLVGKNIHDKLYPASTTKILTTLLALENSPKELNNSVTISQKSVDINSAESGQYLPGVKPNSKISMKSALYAVMLRSANEVAYSVGETISGSNEEFTKLMNEKAKSLGCLNSNFVNPNGLFDKNHYTSVYDMGLISCAAINNKEFMEITKNKSYTLPETKNTVVTHHKLVNNKDYPWCIGGKTGYTMASKHSLITFARKNDQTLVCCVMNSPSAQEAADSTVSAIEYCYKNFKSHNILTKERDNIKSKFEDVKDSILSESFHNASICINTSSSLILPNTFSYYDVNKEINFDSDVSLSEGLNKIGSVTYTYNNKSLASFDIMMNYSGNEQIPIVLPEEYKSGSIDIENEDKECSSSSPSFAVKIIRKIIVGISIGGILVCFVLFSKNKLYFPKQRKIYYFRKRRMK